MKPPFRLHHTDPELEAWLGELDAFLNYINPVRSGDIYPDTGPGGVKYRLAAKPKGSNTDLSGIIGDLWVPLPDPNATPGAAAWRTYNMTRCGTLNGFTCTNGDLILPLAQFVLTASATNFFYLSIPLDGNGVPNAQPTIAVSVGPPSQDPWTGSPPVTPPATLVIPLHALVLDNDTNKVVFVDTPFETTSLGAGPIIADEQCVSGTTMAIRYFGWWQA